MQSLKSLLQFHLDTKDGRAGNITEYLIHEANWAVGYAVVPVGGMLSGEKRLVPLGDAVVSNADRLIVTPHTLAELEEFTPRNLITKSQEGWEALRDGSIPYTGLEVVNELKTPWRGFNELLGSHIEAPDGGFGIVDDVLLMMPQWKVQYIVGRSHDWKRKPTVLIPTTWIKQVSWSGDTVDVTASLAALERNDPSFKPASHG